MSSTTDLSPRPHATSQTAPTLDEVKALLARPLLELVFEAAGVHRRHHDPQQVQCSQLLSIKTGGCAEDCSYCSQSAHHDAPLERQPLSEVDATLEAARTAKQNGADRFCMGAAWRGVKDGPEFDRVLAMVRGVKDLGLETCVTLGMLGDDQARRLKEAGLDYYNHNLDTGRSHYGEVVTTRSYDDRLDTLRAVREAGMAVCCGGIIGMGEPEHARAELLHELCSLEPAPESVPINALVAVEGTPLEEAEPLDWTEIVRMVAAARLLMPHTTVRLSAGRTEMTEEAQALCFLAGANSIFVGDELLTTPNPAPHGDAALFEKLGLEAVRRTELSGAAALSVMGTPSPQDQAAGLDRELTEEMQRWEAAGLRRALSEPGVQGRVDFASNDYLGLARHPALIDAATRALAEHGVGSGASRLLGGGCAEHVAAERAMADWLGAEAALCFPSGYQANLGVTQALVGRGDALFCDARNHASLVDAARLSRAQVFLHRHLDLEELERQLERAKTARRRLVLTEGVFSMDGDTPELARLSEICERHGAWLVLDEAHSVGVLGPEGAGLWADLERSDAGPLAARVVMGGKALGVAGAFVVGSSALREHLINRARAFVFTTAPPPATAAALRASIGLARDADDRRAALHARATDLAERLGCAPPPAAILPWIVGAPSRAVELAGELVSSGIDVRAVRPPTVPEGESGLRIVVHSFNSEAECDDLARGLTVAGKTEEAQSSTGPTRVSASEARGRALFVVGTDTSIGKTVVSALLLRAARRRGLCAYWKPVQTGDDSDTESVCALAGAHPRELLRPAWSFPLPASPHEAAADAGKSIAPERLSEGLTGLRRTLADTQLIVELAGGLLVPYRLEPTLETQADWLAGSATPLVLVARSGLGTLNHTLLTLEALRARHLEPRALFLVGEPHPSNRATLERVTGLKRVFELPWLDPLTGAALETWLDEQDLDDVFET